MLPESQNAILQADCQKISHVNLTANSNSYYSAITQLLLSYYSLSNVLPIVSMGKP